MMPAFFIRPKQRRMVKRLEWNDNRIRDLTVYLTRMQKSVLDKIFFLDKVFDPFDCILDFGCANGDLIKAIHAMFGELHLVGYDISPEMIRQARINCPEAEFTSCWNEINVPFDRTLLNLSSVIHEVYSYSSTEDIGQFWDRVFKSGFRYIAIRDMCVGKDALAPAHTDDLHRLRSRAESLAELTAYEQKWGPILTERDMVHFLLKYTYTQNWESELNENYLPLSAEELIARIPEDYEITYFEHYTLPYKKWEVKKDFGITLDCPTHIKLILRKKD